MPAFLVFPDHLFASLSRFEAGTVFYVWESEEHFRRYRFSKQKLVFHRASLQAMRERLLTKGFAVHYLDSVSYPDAASVFRQMKQDGVDAVSHYEIVDRLSARAVIEAARRFGVATESKKSPLFILDSEDLAAIARLSMRSVYVAARTKAGLLVDASGKPVGGSWSFDSRGSHEGEPTPLTEMEPNRYTDEAISYVASEFGSNPGSADFFLWPVTRNDAMDWLLDFQEGRLAGFASRFEDPSNGSVAAFHSGLSAALNVGLVTPLEACESVIVYGREKNIPLNSVERFVRQVAGWREYARAAYLRDASEGQLLESGVQSEHPLALRLEENGYLQHGERVELATVLLRHSSPSAVARFFIERSLDGAAWAVESHVSALAN